MLGLSSPGEPTPYLIIVDFCYVWPVLEKRAKNIVNGLDLPSINRKT